MNIGPETRVREIATALPASLRVFERHGIDYCCGGGRSLRESCARAGASLDALLVDIETLAKSPADAGDRDWRSEPVEVLLDHLVDHHHAFARSESERAVMLAEKVRRVHGARYPELEELYARVCDVRDDVVPHMAKEEQVLFPWIRKLASGDARSAPGMSLAMPINCMTTDHEELGTVLHRIRELTNGFVPPEGACNTFRALYACLEEFEQDMHMHIHLENDLLFPKALDYSDKSSASEQIAQL